MNRGKRQKPRRRWTWYLFLAALFALGLSFGISLSHRITAKPEASAQPSQTVPAPDDPVSPEQSGPGDIGGYEPAGKGLSNVCGPALRPHR